MERDDTCIRCGTEQGMWVCANCFEVPLCMDCVVNYVQEKWDGHRCLCAIPRHELIPIVYDESRIDDERGWDYFFSDPVE
jgi:hypothetical protein